MIKLLEETFPKHNLTVQACVSCEATSLKLALGHCGRVEMKEAYKLDTEHPVTKSCAAALQAVDQPLKYRYWDFGTDLPVTHVRHGIPSIGYSGMQEFYCHRPIEATGWVTKIGNTSRSYEFETWLVARARPDISVSAADILEEPILLAKATAVCVVPKANHRKAFVPHSELIKK